MLTFSRVNKFCIKFISIALPSIDMTLISSDKFFKRFCSIKYKFGSLDSRSINFFGFNLIICLHNSLPIEPPAPVTQITYPFISGPIKLESGIIQSLPSRSSIVIGLRLSILDSPVVISSIDGI